MAVNPDEPNHPEPNHPEPNHPEPNHPEPNRHALRRLATRRELGRVALRLAIERGPDNVRVEDIAARADVALRTFHNHFASKEEAIMSVGVERSAQIGAALGRRPAGEPLVDALVDAFAEQYAFAGGSDADVASGAGSGSRAGPGSAAGVGRDALDEQWMARVRLLVASPALRGEYLKSIEAAERSLAAALAERAGEDPQALDPRVLAAAVCAAARVAVAHWLEHGPADALPTLLRTAIRRVGA